MGFIHSFIHLLQNPNNKRVYTITTSSGEKACAVHMNKNNKNNENTKCGDWNQIHTAALCYLLVHQRDLSE